MLKVSQTSSVSCWFAFDLQGFGSKLAATDTHVAILSAGAGAVHVCVSHSRLKTRYRSGWDGADCVAVVAPGAVSIALTTAQSGQHWLAVGTATTVQLFRYVSCQWALHAIRMLDSLCVLQVP